MKTKIAIFKIFFIPFPTSTYVKTAAYNFVDFRIKHAGMSNYGGLLFFAPGKKQLKVNLSIQNSAFREAVSGGGKIVEYVIKIRIPSWLERPAVLPLLLYRKLRYGYTFRRIPLSQGKYAIVDPDDYERLSKHKWYASPGHNTYYAVRGQWSPVLKKRLNIAMHREVIDVPDNLFVDHINHNGWDNRKANLRPATAADNARNARHPRKNTTSKYRGIWYSKSKKRWRAGIGLNGKTIHVGYFRNEIDAGKAYDKAAKKYYGEFAILNFPGDTDTHGTS